MNSPFSEQQDVSYGQLVMSYTQEVGKNGRPFWLIKLMLFPIGGEGVIERDMRSFSDDWNKFTKKSIEALVKQGKLTSPESIDQSWVAFEFRSYPDYRSSSIDYAKANNPGVIETDDNGREFVERTAIWIQDVFESEEQARADMEKLYEGQMSPVEVEEETKSKGKGKAKKADPVTIGDDLAERLLGHYVTRATSDGAFDIVEFRNSLMAHPALSVYFAVKPKKVEEFLKAQGIQVTAVEGDLEDEIPF